MTAAIVENVHASVRTLGVPVEILYAGNSDRDIEAAFANLSQKPGAALLITVDAFFYNRRALIVTLAARHALPTVYFAREFAEIGGLISYGTNFDNQHEPVGTFTGRLLKSRKPARPSRRAADKIRPCYQLGHRPRAWPRRAAHVGRARRRGDRMMGWMAPLRHLNAKLL